jgi:uncharacterized protein YebE (UPF0316 family)
MKSKSQVQGQGGWWGWVESKKRDKKGSNPNCIQGTKYQVTKRTAKTREGTLRVLSLLRPKEAQEKQEKVQVRKLKGKSKEKGTSQKTQRKK